MAYLSLYRRWRSQSFAEVVGQDHIVQTLKNSLDLGRISHAYLFAGPRGTGKTTMARLFAKGLNCVRGPSSDFCQECAQCRQITQGNSLDVIEIDGASNRGIDEIRDLREQVRYAPVNNRYKVYIIDEVHMLTPDAFNALLKTLEEPPERVVFIFATTDPQKIPATILSRCQRYDFKRFSVEEITNHLENVLAKEGVTPGEGALEAVAEHADGGMRDALGIVDQCLAYSTQLTADVVSEVLGTASRANIIQFLQSLSKKNAAELIGQINSLYLGGKDLAVFVRDLLRFLRKGAVHPEMLTDNGISPEEGWILQVMEVFAACDREMRYINDPGIPLELAVLKLVSPGDPQGLEAKVHELESKLAALSTKIEQGFSGHPAALTQGVRADEAIQVSQTTAAVAPAALGAGSSEQDKLKVIQDNWFRFLQMLHDERLVQPEAFLREGFPVRLENSTLVVAFSSNRGFHKASAEQEKHRQPAEHALAKMFGHEMSIQCVTEDGQPAEVSRPAEEEKKDQESEPKYDESVNAALRLFGGTIIDIKKQEKGDS